MIQRKETQAMHDSNVALKVTWVYGKTGPFTTPCTPEGRRINIVEKKKVWCSDKECLCRKILRLERNIGTVPVKDSPCYDADIFRRWRFAAGIFATGPRRDQPMRILHAREGALAFFTSKRQDMDEKERIVIGCYEIAKLPERADPDYGFLIPSVPSARHRVWALDKAPRFWDFYTQSGPPRWGCGLFRYLSDQQARALHGAVKAAAR